MVKLLVIGCGGFIGAIARYGLSGWVSRCAKDFFPAGTLVVNVLGCFAIGLLMCLVKEKELLSPHARLFLMAGFLGSFTTFSTFGYETFDLLRAGNYHLAILNSVANVLLGLGAVSLGWLSARAF